MNVERSNLRETVITNNFSYVKALAARCQMKKSSRAAAAARARGATRARAPKPGWTFLTNHSHVLICLRREPASRLRDVAALVGITERAVQTMVADLVRAGVLTRVRNGRRNHYLIHTDAPLRHPVEAGRTMGSLLQLADEPRGTEAGIRERSDNKTGLTD